MQKMRFVLGLAVLSLGVGCSKNLDENAADRAVDLQAGGQVVSANELLVKFKPGVSAQGKANAFGRMNAKVQEHIVTNAMKRANDKEGIYLLHANENAMDAIAMAKGMSEIEYAEPNYIYQHFAVSNDTYFTSGQLWGMSANNNSFGCQAATAWGAGKTGSSTVYVGIIDEGYMYEHEDLAANAGVNPGEIAGDGVDNDNNGLVDDVYGWDFDGGNSSVFDGSTDDHGTHVAGTIGGVGGNGKGVAGVVWNVKLLGAKFLGRRGGSTANAIKAVDYFTDLKTRQVNRVNIVATNNSWGGGGYSKSLEDAIKRANDADILFIAAAGNSGTNNDATASYPSGYNVANVIAVANITSTGALASSSQYGATTVDLGAPGSSIISSVPKSTKGAITSGYASYTGTSMATPHVTGAAALYASTNSGASASAIKAAILNAASTTPTGSLAGKCVTGGRLNVSGF